jgi:NB-ARC domain
MDNFEQAWQNLLRDVFVGGNLTIGNITQILNIFIVISQSSSPESNTIPENIPYRGAVKFFGRSEELEILHQRLQQTERVAISAVSGMGGVGKTELAIQYAQKHKNEDYPGGVCWLQARSSDFSNQIFNFARLNLKLKVPEELGGQPLSSEQKLEWCWQNWQPPGTVLLIIDDVTDLGSCREIIQRFPARFRVLVTTRQRNLESSFSELLLNVLSPEVSLELLKALIGESRVEEELQAAKSLCEWLGYLPLGLELIGRYLAKDRFLRIEKMLERLNVQTLENEALNKEPIKYIMTAQRGVKAAFELSWKELEKLDQIVTDVARLLGLLELDRFSWELHTPPVIIKSFIPRSHTNKLNYCEEE